MTDATPQPDGGDVRIPMDQHDFIKKEMLDNPHCGCGRCWLPLWIPAMRGYVRQCPSCPMTASYCACDFPMSGGQGSPF